MPEVCVIDDDVDMREFVANAARQWGFHPVREVAPQDINLDLDMPTGIVIIDLFMPEMDGVELLRKLAQRGCTASVILMSGGDRHVLNSSRVLALELKLNVLGVLSKPFRARALLAMLNRGVATGRPQHVPLDSQQVLLPPSEIRHGLRCGHLRTFFQPQIDLSDGSIVGVEALARWQHPEYGLLLPASFIKVAEQTGDVDEIANQVLHASLRHLRAWDRLGLVLRASLNLSARTLEDVVLPERLVDAANQHGVEPSRIAIELTETAVMENIAQSLDVLTRLRMKGFQLSIDDFGTGYSSLEKLAKIPFTELKIDRSFVSDLDSDHDAETISRLTIVLAHELGITAVAEGIERAPVRKKLVRLGCDIGQGFGIAMPMPAEEIARWCTRYTGNTMAAPTLRN